VLSSFNFFYSLASFFSILACSSSAFAMVG
jgi:hypothetical protein